jgi:hypothetical protein
VAEEKGKNISLLLLHQTPKNGNGQNIILHAAAGDPQENRV